MVTVARLCACHGEPMYWNRDKRCRAGGFWHCRVARAAQNAQRFRVRMAGRQYSYRIDPAQREHLKTRLAAFRERQAAEYQEATDGGFRQTVPRA